VAEKMNLELRVALRVVTALDARVDVENVGMSGLVVKQQRRDVVEDRAAFDAAVGRFAGSLEFFENPLTHLNERCSWWHFVT
jgi:hypothetical protein